MADKQIIEALRRQVAEVQTGRKLKPAKVVITEREAVMYQPHLDQIKWWESRAEEILEGTFDRKAKVFVTSDGARRFVIREAYWATEVF